jgi:hypothetical protein
MYDDDPVSVSISPGAGPEGGNVQFTVSPSREAAFDISVYYTTGDWTAGVDDYQAVTTPEEIVIPAHEPYITISVPAKSDEVKDPGEDFSVCLSNPTGAPVDVGTGVGRIEDVCPYAFSVSDASVTEGGMLVFTITASQPVQEYGETVSWSISGGSASPGDYDYVAGGTVHFGAADTSGTFEVPICDDTEVEGTEDVGVHIYGADWGRIDDGDGVGTIYDNDYGELQVAAPPGAASAALAATVTDDALQNVVQEAVGLWTAAGASTADVKAFQRLTFRIADLPGNTLGLASRGVITIDVDAAGCGWFTDTSAQPTSHSRRSRFSRGRIRKWAIGPRQKPGDTNPHRSRRPG